jgi:lysophospholipase L1-like esterase
MKKLLSAFLAALFCATQALAGGPPPIPPPYVSVPAVVRAATGTSITFFGDSTEQNGSVSVPPTAAFPFTAAPQYATGSQAQSTQGWLLAFANGGFTTDYVAFGYPGSVNGLRNVTVLTAGNCTPSATLTFTPNAPTGTPANTAGAISIPFNAAGQATIGQQIAFGNGGSGYTGSPTYTVSGGSCTTQPTLGYTLTGTGNFGVAGDQTANMIFRAAQDVCPAKPDIVVASMGTNDINNNVPVATVEANIQAIVSTLQACNIRVVLEAIQPRTNGVSGWTLTMDKIRQRVNNFERSICQASRIANPAPSVVCVDVSKYWTNPADANGSVQATMVSDGVHPGPGGAMARALVIWEAISSWATHGPFIPNSQSDIYDATNNPAGNLLGTAGLFLGTGGTATAPCTGTVASSWTIDTNSTGTVSCVGSIESARTDGKPGQRQVVTMSVTGGGANERFRLIYNLGTGNLTRGTDGLMGQIYLDLSNLSNVLSAGCEIFETATNNQGSFGVFQGSTGAAFPMLSSAQLAKMEETVLIPDSGLTAAGSFLLPCTMPPITTQAAASAYNVYVYVTGNANWTATLKAGNARVTKTAL